MWRQSDLAQESDRNVGMWRGRGGVIRRIGGAESGDDGRRAGGGGRREGRGSGGERRAEAGGEIYSCRGQSEDGLTQSPPASRPHTPPIPQLPFPAFFSPSSRVRAQSPTLPPAIRAPVSPVCRPHWVPFCPRSLSAVLAGLQAAFVRAQGVRAIATSTGVREAPIGTLDLSI